MASMGGAGEAPACKGPSHKKEESTMSKAHRASFQNRELCHGPISTQGEKLPTVQYLGEKGQGQEFLTEKDGVKA
jgi:hypothetical protein